MEIRKVTHWRGRDFDFVVDVDELGVVLNIIDNINSDEFEFEMDEHDTNGLIKSLIKGVRAAEDWDKEANG